MTKEAIGLFNNHDELQDVVISSQKASLKQLPSWEENIFLLNTS